VRLLQQPSVKPSGIALMVAEHWLLHFLNDGLFVPSFPRARSSFKRNLQNFVVIKISAWIRSDCFAGNDPGVEVDVLSLTSIVSYRSRRLLFPLIVY
jgi:hypothetical protein